jgi:SAM-dependent methyltransferase
MSFEVGPEVYERLMGRFSQPLAVAFADAAGVRAGQRALDVGCGPGALTAELVRRLGAASVCAVEPSSSFFAAAAGRFPQADIRQAPAEQIPFADGSVDSALAQLSVHFMTDAVVGLREMARVTRPGGMVAACVWDHAGGRSPVELVWRAARELDPAVPDESGLAGVADGHLVRLFAEAGLAGAEQTTITVRARHASSDDWWQPFTLGVGPAGEYVTSLADQPRARLRERLTELTGPGPVEISATAWTVTCRAPHG